MGRKEGEREGGSRRERNCSCCWLQPPRKPERKEGKELVDLEFLAAILDLLQQLRVCFQSVEKDAEPLKTHITALNTRIAGREKEREKPLKFSPKTFLAAACCRTMTPTIR